MFSLLAGGCVCAFLAATSCEFFSYTDSLEAASLPPPFVNQTFGRVGIFGYIIDEANDDECTTYSETLMEAMGTFNTYWMTAQFSAIVGPCKWRMSGLDVWIGWTTISHFYLFISDSFFVSLLTYSYYFLL